MADKKIVVLDANNIPQQLQSGDHIDAGSSKIKNVTDPSAAQEAATKNYVDTRSLTTGKVYALQAGWALP